jgi:hypothetical protein
VAFDSTTALPVCAGGGRFIALDPLHFHYPVQPAAPTISTPLRESCLPRDQSVQPRLLPAGPPDESARFPLAPRRPSWLKFGLRIIVPGPSSSSSELIVSRAAARCANSGGAPVVRSIFRATLSRKLTALFCRLPLPTLIYRPEASDLGDLLRLLVRPTVVLL